MLPFALRPGSCSGSSDTAYTSSAMMMPNHFLTEYIRSLYARQYASAQPLWNVSTPVNHVPLSLSFSGILFLFHFLRMWIEGATERSEETYSSDWPGRKVDWNKKKQKQGFQKINKKKCERSTVGMWASRASWRYKRLEHLCETGEQDSMYGCTGFFIWRTPLVPKPVCTAQTTSQHAVLIYSSSKAKTENSNSYGFDLHRPSIKGTKLLSKIIKAIIKSK